MCLGPHCSLPLLCREYVFRLSESAPARCFVYLGEQQVPHDDVAAVPIIRHGKFWLYPLPGLVPTPAQGGCEKAAEPSEFPHHHPGSQHDPAYSRVIKGHFWPLVSFFHTACGFVPHTLAPYSWPYCILCNYYKWKININIKVFAARALGTAKYQGEFVTLSCTCSRMAVVACTAAPHGSLTASPLCSIA